MKTDKKIKYYQLRAEGKKQKEAAELLGVSDRTCRRWESEARSYSKIDETNARELYSAQLLDQSKSVVATFAMLESIIPTIDFSNLSDSQKLDFFLKYGRRVDELESKAPKMPDDIKLQGIAAAEQPAGNISILELQEKIYNMAAAGEITDEQARKKIALLTEIRKSVTAADNNW